VEVDLDQTRVAAGRTAVLKQRTLHHPDQTLSVRRDGERLHALVGHASLRVGGDLLELGGTRRRDRVLGGQLQAA
jgi:hypothetical protein